MLAGLFLTGGGIYAIVKKGDRKRGVLMIIAGLVMFANVAIFRYPRPRCTDAGTPSRLIRRAAP